MFEGGETSRVDFCELIVAQHITDARFAMHVCRMTQPIWFKSFAYLTKQGYRPRGKRKLDQSYETFMISGFHGVNANWVAHRLTYMLVREATTAGCTKFYYNLADVISKPATKDTLGCYTLAGDTLGSDPIGTHTYPAQWDDGTGLIMKNSNFISAIVLGRIEIKNENYTVPVVVAYLDSFEREIQRVLVTKDRDEFQGYAEFYGD